MENFYREFPQLRRTELQLKMRLAGLDLQLKRVAHEQNTRLAVTSRAQIGSVADKWVFCELYLLLILGKFVQNRVFTWTDVSVHIFCVWRCKSHGTIESCRSVDDQFRRTFNIEVEMLHSLSCRRLNWRRVEIYRVCPFYPLFL